MSLALVAEYLQMEVCKANVILQSPHRLLLGFDFWLKLSGPVNPEKLLGLDITESQNKNLHVLRDYLGPTPQSCAPASRACFICSRKTA